MAQSGVAGRRSRDTPRTHEPQNHRRRARPPSRRTVGLQAQPSATGSNKPPSGSMVRKGSPVRVRQRASDKGSGNAAFFCPNGVRSAPRFGLGVFSGGPTGGPMPGFGRAFDRRGAGGQRSGGGGMAEFRPLGGGRMLGSCPRQGPPRPGLATGRGTWVALCRPRDAGYSGGERHRDRVHELRGRHGLVVAAGGFLAVVVAAIALGITADKRREFIRATSSQTSHSLSSFRHQLRHRPSERRAAPRGEPDQPNQSRDRSQHWQPHRHRRCGERSGSRIRGELPLV